MEGTILVADDDRSIRTVLTQALIRSGCQVHSTGTAAQLMRWVNEGRGDVVITDVLMPDGNGLDLIPEIHAARAELPVVVISAQNGIETALRARDVEAWDYLPKPFDLPDLMSCVNKALARSRQSPAPARNTSSSAPLLGRSAAMQELFRRVAHLAGSDLPILITGESGAGKTRVAHVLHDASPRAAASLIELRGFDLSPGEDPVQMVRETVEAAVSSNGPGTILIDDPSMIDPAILRALLDQAAELDVRVLCTGQAQKTSELPADVYYRLAGAVINVPDLAHCSDDIPIHLLNLISPDCSIEEQAMELLRQYPWPGNLRQLANVARTLELGARGPITAAEVADVLATQPKISAEQTGGNLGKSVEKHLRQYFDMHEGALPPDGVYARILREIEIPLIETALESTNGNQAQCAELLGINRNTLRKKMLDHGIEVTRRRKLM